MYPPPYKANIPNPDSEQDDVEASTNVLVRGIRALDFYAFINGVLVAGCLLAVARVAIFLVQRLP